MRHAVDLPTQLFPSVLRRRARVRAVTHEAPLCVACTNASNALVPIAPQAAQTQSTLPPNRCIESYISRLGSSAMLSSVATLSNHTAMPRFAATSKNACTIMLWSPALADPRPSKCSAAVLSTQIRANAARELFGKSDQTDKHCQQLQ